MTVYARGLEAEDLVSKLATPDLPAPVMTSAAFERDADAAGRQRAVDLLDQSPEVVSRELAAYGRRFPRRSGLVREYACEADAARQGEACATTLTPTIDCAGCETPSTSTA